MRLRTIAVCWLATLVLAGSAWAGMSQGQTLYVPSYSHIYHGVKTRPVDLTITLSLRNTDLKRAIQVTAVDYYDTEGRVIKRYLDKPLVLGPLASKEYVVEQTDNAGGSGANFIVRWKAETAVNAPVVEAVMIGSSNNLGISFTSAGIEIKE